MSYFPGLFFQDEMCQEMLTRSSPDTVLPTNVGSQIPIQNTFYPDTHTVPNVNMLDVPLTSAYTIFYNEKRLLLSQENPSTSSSLPPFLTPSPLGRRDRQEDRAALERSDSQPAKILRQHDVHPSLPLRRLGAVRVCVCL